MWMPVAPSSVSDVTLHPHSPIFSLSLFDWLIDFMSQIFHSLLTEALQSGDAVVSKMSTCISEGTWTKWVISISIPAKSKGKDNLKEAVLSTCLAGSDGQNVAGCTHAQAVLGKYADIIGGGVNL